MQPRTTFILTGTVLGAVFTLLLGAAVVAAGLWLRVEGRLLWLVPAAGAGLVGLVALVWLAVGRRRRALASSRRPLPPAAGALPAPVAQSPARGANGRAPAPAAAGGQPAPANQAPARKADALLPWWSIADDKLPAPEDGAQTKEEQETLVTNLAYFQVLDLLNRPRPLNLPRVDFSNVALPFIDLSNAYLWEANLSGANLLGANISGANLRAANLSGAILNGANLSGANLTGTNLRGANLSGADLTDAKIMADLTGATVTDEQLAKAKSLQGTTLSDGTKRA